MEESRIATTTATLGASVPREYRYTPKLAIPILQLTFWLDSYQGIFAKSEVSLYPKKQMNLGVIMSTEQIVTRINIYTKATFCSSFPTYLDILAEKYVQ